MTRRPRHVIELLASSEDLEIEEAAKRFDAVIAALARAITETHRVEVPGLGTFSRRKNPEYEGRNPRTGQRIIIPAQIKVRFKPAPRLVGEAGEGEADKG